MLNLISFRMLDLPAAPALYPERGPLRPDLEIGARSGELPRLLDWIDPNLRLHAGLFVMLIAVAFVWWLLFRSKIGFAFRASGANPDAARYAGMRSGLVIVAAMATAGALAGLAGAAQVQGVLGRASPGFSAGIGFDAIALALLGRSHPVGILFAGILFGGLEAGGRQMQVDAGVSIDLIGDHPGADHRLHRRTAAGARDLPVGLRRKAQRGASDMTDVTTASIAQQKIESSRRARRPGSPAAC